MGLISVCEPSPFRLLLHEIALYKLNLRWRDTKIKTVKRGLLCAVSQPPLGPSKPGTLPSKEVGSLPPVLPLSPCVGTSFSVSDSICTPLFCFSMCVIRHLANPTALRSHMGRAWGPSGTQLRSGAWEPTALHRLPGGNHWPWETDALYWSPSCSSCE